MFAGLSNLKENFTSGPDNVPEGILRRCKDSLCEILCFLFNQSLKTGKFPEAWKESFIIPLFKSGNAHDASNYRGIAKLNSIPKLFESLLVDELFFNAKEKLTNSQHGFFKGRSITTNLLELSTYVSDAFSQKQQVDVGYFDFSKAFDQINHKLLVNKLHLFGMSTNLCNWFSSYLCNRIQKVKFKSCVSSPITVHSGVPQGSHLGPLLFLIFVNDLPEKLKSSNVLLYADDAKVFSIIRSYDDCVKLQKDFDNLSQWSNDNFLQLNIKKCKTLTFSRIKDTINFDYHLSGSNLGRCEHFNDLGVTFDSKMTFKVHIDSIIAKAKSRLGLIKRYAKEFDDPYITKTLFVSLVRSILEFACQVWSPHYVTHINRIESVQKQFLLFALRQLNWENRLILPPYRNRLLLLNLNTLEDRRKLLSCCLIWNLMNNKIDSSNLLKKLCFICPVRTSRFFVPLRIDHFRYDYLNFEPLKQCLSIYNTFHFLICNSMTIFDVKVKIQNYCKLIRN